MMGNRWYIIICKIGREDEAEGNLLAQGIECYNPHMLLPKRFKGEDIQQKESLFPDYIFVYFDPTIQSARSINYTPGVQTLLRFGDMLATIDSKIIDALKAKFNGSIVVPEEPNHSLNAGDKVVIDKGIFAGIEAIFKERDGDKRSIIMLKMLGTEHQLTVDNSVLC